MHLSINKFVKRLILKFFLHGSSFRMTNFPCRMLYKKCQIMPRLLYCKNISYASKYLRFLRSKLVLAKFVNVITCSVACINLLPTFDTI